MQKPIYLDYMATTPVDDRVIEKMLSCMGQGSTFGNPSSQSHIYGWQAKELVEAARQQVADCIHADVREIVWTSGASESNNLALQGDEKFYCRKGKHIVTCKTEHKAVLDVCKQLVRDGFEVTYLTPEKNGLIDLVQFKNALRDDTILASIMLVNNEIGVIQDIASMAKITRNKGVLLHVDAAQAVGKISVDVNQLDVDLMSLSGHKAYGPKGVGALYVRRTPRVRLAPLFHGGGQEQGIRCGTLATHQIVGMGEAFAIAQKELQTDRTRIKNLRDMLWSGIKDLGGITLNGDMQQRVAGNLNISVADVDGEALLLGLNQIAVSSGSACNSVTIEPSHVLRAIGVPDELAHSAIRFTLGRFTTQAEIETAIEHINATVKRLRDLAPGAD